jgi:hypothetical protein
MDTLSTSKEPNSGPLKTNVENMNSPARVPAEYEYVAQAARCGPALESKEEKVAISPVTTKNPLFFFDIQAFVCLVSRDDFIININVIVSDGRRLGNSPVKQVKPGNAPRYHEADTILLACFTFSPNLNGILPEV